MALMISAFQSCEFECDFLFLCFFGVSKYTGQHIIQWAKTTYCSSNYFHKKNSFLQKEKLWHFCWLKWSCDKTQIKTKLKNKLVYSKTKILRKLKIFFFEKTQKLKLWLFINWNRDKTKKTQMIKKKKKKSWQKIK